MRALTQPEPLATYSMRAFHSIALRVGYLLVAFIFAWSLKTSISVVPAAISTPAATAVGRELCRMPSGKGNGWIRSVSTRQRAHYSICETSENLLCILTKHGSSAQATEYSCSMCIANLQHCFHDTVADRGRTGPGEWERQCVCVCKGGTAKQ